MPRIKADIGILLAGGRPIVELREPARCEVDGCNEPATVDVGGCDANGEWIAVRVCSRHEYETRPRSERC